MAVGDWSEAANYLDQYIKMNPADWDAQFSRAVAYANARDGDATDVAALRAYNDAIALRPSDVERNLFARLLTYRAAMLKRLKRLSEAEADLNQAAELATNQYEREDLAYNRACVAAMRNRRNETLNFTKSLLGTRYIGVIRAHLDDYFAHFAHDPEFLALLTTDGKD
jgi:Flp pilus assembly protein TadD